MSNNLLDDSLSMQLEDWERKYKSLHARRLLAHVPVIIMGMFGVVALIGALPQFDSLLLVCATAIGGCFLSLLHTSAVKDSYRSMVTRQAGATTAASVVQVLNLYGPDAAAKLMRDVNILSYANRLRDMMQEFDDDLARAVLIPAASEAYSVNQEEVTPLMLLSVRKVLLAQLQFQEELRETIKTSTKSRQTNQPDSYENDDKIGWRSTPKDEQG